MNNKCEQMIREMLATAGIEVNGNNPWDIQVYNKEFYRRTLTEGDLGLGESYMQGWWDAEKVDELIYRILVSRTDEKIQWKFSILFNLFLERFFNMQSKRRAFIVGERHYDLGNDLFQSMLDRRMNYSCAYWRDAKNLDEAQDNKLDLICRKLNLEPGMRVLDIGCGWGPFGKYASAKYGVEVTGITVSKEQVELGQKLCEGLPIYFKLMDYRNLSDKFDRIVSVGMIEHVGYKNYSTFFNVVNRCLNENGLFLLHTIGSADYSKKPSLWTHKYIFPNGRIPSGTELNSAFENLFVMEDWHNFGNDYDRTLMAWYENFLGNWNNLKSHFSDDFFRMWRFYLLSFAGVFRARRSQLWQIVLSKNGVPGGYLSVR